MRTVLRVVAHALALALLLCASVGHAQPAAPNKARARELYAQGQQLFRQGDFSGAQRAFEDAYRAVPNPVVLLSVAECQVRTENFAGALSSLQQYLAERPSAPDRPQVEAQIQNLELKPGFVTVESVPAGAQIFVDGESSGHITPFELSMRAGTHTIALTVAGHARIEQRIEVTVGARQRLTLTLTPEQVAVAPEPAAEPDQAAAEAQERGKRHATAGVWTSLAIAGVTAATGTGLGVAALKRDKDYSANLDKNPPVVDKKLKQQGERLALFSDVTIGIAAVAGVTALVLYLTSAEPTAETGAQAFMVAPELSPRQVGLQGQFRF